jgi:MFS transporter, DHA1 family, multidrug resistance protein
VLFAYISASPFVLQADFGISAQAFSLVFATSAMALVAGSQLSARLARRVSPHRLLGVGLGLAGVATSLLLLAALTRMPLPVFLVPLVLAIGSLGLSIPNATALALLPHPRSAGTASAQLGALQFAVGATLAPLTGLGLGTPAVSMAAVMTGVSAAALLTFATSTSST